MAFTDAAVGPLVLPVPVDAANSAIADPVVDGVLDYLAFCLDAALDDKFRSLIANPTDAVPTANRFNFNPREPRGHHVRLPVPALFVWWEGKSLPTEKETATVLYAWRRRRLHVLYVFPEGPSMEEMVRRAGLLSVVDAVIQQAFDWGWRPDYTPPGLDGNGDPWPAGTPLQVALGGVERIAVRVDTEEGIVPGRFGIDDLTTTIEPKPTSGRDYPAVFATLISEERIDGPTPDEMNAPTTFTVRGSDGSTQQVKQILQRTLPP